MPGKRGDIGPGRRLPARLLSFIGRERLLTELRRAVGQTRQLTLTGVGGAGKTTLALELADQTRRLFDEVRFVPLNGLKEPDLLVQHLAKSVGTRDQAVVDTVDALIEVLTHKGKLLLVVDNCEHLVEDLGSLIATLLEAVPELHVLATSREALAIPGEVVKRVPPLELPAGPELSSALKNESVLLLLDRAAKRAPDWELTPENWPDVYALLRWTAGIPLMIELVVARLPSMSAKELMERVKGNLALLKRNDRTVLSHHQSSSLVIGSSYDLLTPPARLLWARVAVFECGFTLAAAEAVCSDEQLPADEVNFILAELVDKSIVIRSHSDDRYELLNPMRQFGLEKLRKSGEDAVLHDRYRDFFVRFAMAAADNWLGPDEVGTFRRIRADLANLRSVMSAALESPSTVEAALVIAVSLGRNRYIFFSGSLVEGRHWLQAALKAVPVADRATPLYVGALAMDAFVARCMGTDPEEVAATIAKAAELAAQMNAPAPALTFVQGAYLHFNGATTGATNPILRQAVAEFDALGDAFAGDRHMAHMILSLSAALLLDDEDTAQPSGRETALRDAEEHLAECEAVGAPWATTWGVWALGITQVRVGRLDLGIENIIESLRQQRAMEDSWGPAFGVPTLAWAMSQLPDLVLEDARRAAILVGTSYELERRTGISISTHVPHTRFRDEATKRLRNFLSDEEFQAAFKIGQLVQELDEAVAIALDGVLPDDATPPGPAASHDRPCDLTEQQWVIAQKVAEGKTNRQIGTDLALSHRTIEHHVQNIYRALDMATGSRPGLAAWVRGHTSSR